MSNEHTVSSPPRIGVMHLMTLTMGVAISLGVQMRGIDLSRDAFNLDPLQTIQLVFVICNSFLSGLALAGLYWLFDWRQKKGAFYVQPGHWLVIGWGVSVLVLSVTQMLVFRLFDSQWQSQNSLLGWLMMLPAMLRTGLSAVIFGYACIYTKGIWRIVLAALLLQAIGDAMFTILIISGTGVTLIQQTHYVAVALQFLPIVFLVLAFFWDLIKKCPRDWIHYCGVALPLGMLMIEVAAGIYYRFFSA